jgi:hypothetical protein
MVGSGEDRTIAAEHADQIHTGAVDGPVAVEDDGHALDVRPILLQPACEVADDLCGPPLAFVAQDQDTGHCASPSAVAGLRIRRWCACRT